MSKISIVFKIFLAVGILLLGGAVYWISNTLSFQRSALKADGTVVEMLRQVSTSSNSGTSVTYKPRVKFTTPDGIEHELIPSTSSNPPAFDIGEKVSVLYNPNNPNNAQIAGMNAYWGPIIIGFMGLIFALVGGVPLYLNWKKAGLNKRLLVRGKKITSKIISVGPNTSIRINGRHPFQIVSQWHDTHQNKVYTFNSPSIYFNPVPFMDGKENIAVYIEPGNPEKYLVDISFLPKEG